LLTTDAQGHFTVGGVGEGQGVRLEVRDDRFALDTLDVAADHKDRARDITFPLSPPHVLVGRVTRADTGKPVANAALTAMTVGRNSYGKADADGRFRLPTSAASRVSLSASAPEGEPYLTLKKDVEWPKGAVRHEVDLALPRAVLVTGTVTEAPSGKPVAGASVQFFPQQRDNPEFRPDVAALWRGGVVTGLDGKFQLPALPGPGHLLVHGPTADYVHREVVYATLATGRRTFGGYYPGLEGNAYFGGQRVYVHGLAALQLKADAAPEPLQVTLRRGVTVQGRLVDPDGKPVARAWMMSRLQVSDWEHIVRMPAQVRDGRFELRGCDPEATYRALFYDAARDQGAVAEIAGKQTSGEPGTVRLAPCGSATLRLVSRDGQPLRKRATSFNLVVTPGDDGFAGKGPMADMLWNAYAYPEKYQRGARTDDRGCLQITGVIPGVTYRFNVQGGFRDFTAKSGEAADWGDLVDPVLYAEPE
jgi:hypothetical protein